MGHPGVCYVGGGGGGGVAGGEEEVGVEAEQVAFEAEFGFGELVGLGDLHEAATVEDAASVLRRHVSPGEGADGLGGDQLDGGGVFDEGDGDGAVVAGLEIG